MPAAARPRGENPSIDREKIEAIKQAVGGGGAPVSGAAPGGMPAGPMPTAGGTLTIADVRFTPSKTWRFTHPSSAMRQAQYEIPGEAGPGEAVVYFFGTGQGGDVEQNAQRWLDQFTPEAGAAPESKARETREVNGIKLTLVRTRGTYNSGMAMGGASEAHPGWALVGLILESPGGPVFMKITGPAATIAAASAAIDELANSLQLVR